MRPPRAQVVATSIGGYWKVYAKPFGGKRTDITTVRGAPTTVGSMSTKDPFGPAAASISFPKVTFLDALGCGDLTWCKPEVDIDIAWMSPPVDFTDDDGNQVSTAEQAVYTWEGYVVSFEYAETGALTLQLRGAMLQMDNYLAKPEYLYRPLPYEVAISRQFDNHPDLRLGPCRGAVYRGYHPVFHYLPGPKTQAEANSSTWADRDSMKPVKMPKTGAPYRKITLLGHGFSVGDSIRITGAKVRTGFVNNGVYKVLRIYDDDHFLVRMPKGAVGKQVQAPGKAAVRHDTMFPDWWQTTFDSSKYSASKPWLLPLSVTNGQKWSAMLTRDTGKFEPSLSNYIQGLLANMFTSRGQFTLLLDEGRIPYLTHREHKHVADDDTLVVDVMWPGVRISQLSQDYTQRIGVVYAQGRATNGDVYTGMQVTADGSSTWYDPAAYRRQVHPVAGNKWLDKGVMRREVMISYSDGLDEAEAWTAAGEHLARFMDPGFTGSMSLDVDPMRGDEPFPRQAITAGMSIQVKGLAGRREGLLFHITEQGIDAESKVNLTIDSLYRDHLTVDQVRKRAHDSLVPYRTLSTSGTYDPKIPDLLYPWSYAKGAGCVPYAARGLFTSAGPKAFPQGSVEGMFDIPFPWSQYTKRFPPKKYPGYYMRVGPADWDDATKNWSSAKKSTTAGNFYPHHVLLSASGEAKLFQMVAVDRDGNPKKVRFHFSLWYSSAISPSAMPKIPAIGTKTIAKTAKVTQATGANTPVVVSGLQKGHGLSVGDVFAIACSPANAAVDGSHTVASASSTSVAANDTHASRAALSTKALISVPILGTLDAGRDYQAGQPYPFFQNAWEKILTNGTTPLSPNYTAASSQAAITGYGTGYERAGYWPGSEVDHDAITGMLSDEGGVQFTWSFLGSAQAEGVDTRKTAAQNAKNKNAARAYVMLFCDDDPHEETFFLGRIFRKEYAAS